MKNRQVWGGGGGVVYAWFQFPSGGVLRWVCVLGGGVCPGGGYSRGEYPVVATEGVEYPGGGYSGVCLGGGYPGMGTQEG